MKYFPFFFFIGMIAACNKAPVVKNYLTAHGLKGKVKQLTAYYYDNEQAFKAKQQSGKEVTLFDIDGRIVSKTRTDGRFVTRTNFKNGKDEITDTTYLNDTIAGTEKQKLDKNGRPNEQYIYTGDPKNPSAYSSFTFHAIFKYDENSNLAETDNYDGKKIVSKISYRHNDKDQLVEEDTYAYSTAPAQTGKTTFAYDEAGNMIRQTSYDPAGKLTYSERSAYSNFDRQGNWLLSASTMSDGAKSSSKTFTAREFVYY